MALASVAAGFALRDLPESMVQALKAAMDDDRLVRMIVAVVHHSLEDRRNELIGTTITSGDHIHLGGCKGVLIDLDGLRSDEEATPIFRAGFKFRDISDDTLKTIRAVMEWWPVRMVIDVLPDELIDRRTASYMGSADCHIELKYAKGKLIEVRGLELSTTL